MSWDEIISELHQSSRDFSEILPPITVMEEFEKLARENSEVIVEEWGTDASNREIKSYRFGYADKVVLLYAFADPAEAVGGTGILALSRLLLDKNSAIHGLGLGWVIVPCLNFIDQPCEGKALAKMQKSANQEVDWCVNNPRPETSAILKLADKYKPVYTFPLHDEYHHNKYVEPYCGLGRSISIPTRDAIIEALGEYNMGLNPEYTDSRLGNGFFLMESIGDEIKNSTFYHFLQTGQVLVCEMPTKDGMKDSDLLFLQMKIGMLVLRDCLADSA